MKSSELLFIQWTFNYEDCINHQFIFSAEYPWQAAVLRKEGLDNVYVCAGTLMDSRNVITAAHCVDGYANLLFSIET